MHSLCRHALYLTDAFLFFPVFLFCLCILFSFVILFQESSVYFHSQNASRLSLGRSRDRLFNSDFYLRNQLISLENPLDSFITII